MKIRQIYSHLNGYEYLLVHKRELWDEIVNVINSVDANLALTKESKEKSRIGEILYSPKEMNSLYKREFMKYNWIEKKINYYVNEDLQTTRKTVFMLHNDEQKAAIEAAGFIPYRTNNQVDFVKDDVAVEIQFGKYFSVQYDLHVKHTFFYGRGDINVGIEIIPMHNLMRKMSTGVAWYENELSNIVREGRSNPPIPIILIGVEPN